MAPTAVEPTADAAPRIRRTHIALFVKDPFATAPWYEDVLGMQVTARGSQWVFLSFGTKHHDIALIQAPPGPDDQPPRGTINLQHYGLEIEGNVDELRRLHARLQRRGVEVVKVTDHKVGYGVYFNDPDGHRFEFFCETVHDDEEGKRILGLYQAPSIPIDISSI
jgi:catechol-2,3-dioxygenase